MHNAAFAHLGIKALYLPMPIKPEDFARSVNYLLKDHSLSGFNVTIPYKEKIIRFLDSTGHEAGLIGAVNTVSSRGLKYKGDNTDGKGFIKALTRDLGVKPRGRAVFILGAGGAARAVGFSLALEDAGRIVFADAAPAKAEKLVSDMKKSGLACAISSVSLKNAGGEISSSDIVVNATPVGLEKKDPSSIDPALLRKEQVICDCIYNPAETKLLEAARKKGLKRMNGMGMLIYQGAESFRIWTGLKAPVDVMRRAVLACKI